MKPLHAILAAAALMAACDQRGSNPPTDLSTGSKGPASSNANDSTPVDTSRPGGILLLGADLQGPASASTPGTERRLDFFLGADQSLHVRGSSDGAPAGGAGLTYGRQTTWEVRFTSMDSIRGNLTTISTEVGMNDSIWNFVDSTDGTLPHVVRVRMHTLSGASEARIVADSNALVSVKVVAWSGFDTKFLGWTPPLLPNDTLVQLLWAGDPAKIVGASTFQVRVPHSSMN